MSGRTFKITICFESRQDGGLRAYSDDVPGLVLSSTDIDGVIDEVPTVLSVILSDRLGTEIEVKPLASIREALEDNGIVEPRGFIPGPREYVVIRQM
jgi:hypothetical protein